MENSTNTTDGTDGLDGLDGVDDNNSTANGTDLDGLDGVDNNNNSTNVTAAGDDACQDELDRANTCVSQYADQCTCILNRESFSSMFPQELDTSFQDVINNAGNQDEGEVCLGAEKSICE